jgi:ZIP family zinc transporter/zinc and cadmium transporter
MTYAVIAALANVAGAAAITWRRRWGVRTLETMVALAAGFMLAVAFTEILPEAIRRGGVQAASGALAGYMLVHLTQHTFAPHFHFGEETHEVSATASVSALIGLLMHTFVDGVAIASGFIVSHALGVLIFIAVVLHKLPEGLAISSLFLAAGATRGRAMWAATSLGAATIIGALVGAQLSNLATAGLALSAGVTIYVAASNLVPEFQATRGWRLPVAFFAGSALFFAVRSLVPEA